MKSDPHAFLLGLLLAQSKSWHEANLSLREVHGALDVWAAATLLGIPLPSGIATVPVGARA